MSTSSQVLATLLPHLRDLTIESMGVSSFWSLKKNHVQDSLMWILCLEELHISSGSWNLQSTCLSSATGTDFSGPCVPQAQPLPASLQNERCLRFTVPFFQECALQTFATVYMQWHTGWTQPDWMCTSLFTARKKAPVECRLVENQTRRIHLGT